MDCLGNLLVKMAQEGLRRGGPITPCWRKHEEESVVVLYTPFFVSLASGTLDLETFCHCISDNFHSLKSLLQVFEMVEAYTYNNETKLAIRHLRESVEKNLDTYKTIVQECGLVLPNKSISYETAIKYIEFLLTTASGEGVPSKTKVAANTFAAIAPFMRLYEHLCNTIQISHLYPVDDNISPFFKEWPQEIQALANKTDELLDKLTEHLITDEEELKATEKLYDQAMKLQLEFFASQPISQQTVVPYLSSVEDLNKSQLITIFSDFDFICSLGADYATDNILAKQLVLKSTFSSRSSADFTEELNGLVDQYKDELKQCLENIIDSDVLPGDYEGLKQALTEVAKFEKMANATLEDKGLFKGLVLDVIKLAGKGIKLQKGCREFFQKIVKVKNPKIEVHIISYSLCGDLIRSAFSPDLEVVNIHSNELVWEKSITSTGSIEMVTTGEIIKKVETPFDKHQVFMQILEDRNTCTTEVKHLKVYIGSEVRDLLCLVEADIGIVFGESTSLRALGDRFGISFVPLHCGVVNNQMGLDNWRPRCGVLYTVQSWAEIEAFILGL